MPDREERLRRLAAQRWRIAASLTLVVIVVYFGFIALVAFNKPLLASPVTEGLSLGILLGAFVIVISWLLTWFYVRWANAHYDTALADIDRESGGGAA